MSGAFSVTKLVNLLFYFYYLLIILRIFLSWLRNIDWDTQPFKFVSSLTDPFLNIFRGFIPPIGGMLDISPVVALIVLQVLQGILVGFLYNLGL